VCRFAAYVGPDLPLQSFLLEPGHSLLRQSWQPREMQEALLNADGFGIGWYNGDAPALYRNTHPIWADANLPDLGRSLARPLWLAGVRSATPGFTTGLANTQPFCDDELIFVHNGYVTGFTTHVRGQMRRWLEPELEASIHGNTDSEYLFAVLRQLLRQDEEASLEEALRRLCQQVLGWLDEGGALLNIAVADGRQVFALRHAIDGNCPSLYYTSDDERFPGGQLLASEPLTESDYWLPVPPHHLLVLDPDEPPSLSAL
jgi:glutamine amidotransferase